MQEAEFIKTLQKAGYSYEEFGRLAKIVKVHLYEEFFENYKATAWPHDPEEVLENALEEAEPDDDPQRFLIGNDGALYTRHDFMTMEDFEDEWFAEAGRLYRMVLDILDVEYDD